MMITCGNFSWFSFIFVIFLRCFMVGQRQGDSLRRFDFFDSIFLGQLYPIGFSTKSMVLKMFTNI